MKEFSIFFDSDPGSSGLGNCSVPALPHISLITDEIGGIFF